MRLLSRLLVVFTLLGSLVSVAVPTATADKSGADPAIAAALQRIAQRTHTPADVVLIKAHPEIAKQVADPDRAPTMKVTVKNRVAGAMSVDEEFDTCQEFWGEITAYTLFGFVHWQWRHVVDICWDGVVATRWRSRYPTLTYSDGTAYPGPILGNAFTELPGTPAMSFFQQRIDICVFKYGCYATYTPWSRFNMNGDGSTWWNWGAPGG